LHFSQDKFARAFRLSPDALVISRVEDGMILDVNDGFCAMTGRQREKIIGRTTLDIDLWGNPDDYRRFAFELTSVGRQLETEYSIRTESGRILDCVVSVEMIVIGDDQCALSIIRDISERKRAEAELKSEKQFTETLLEGLPGIFFLYDSTCHLKRWNKAHETATGFCADELRDWYIPDWHKTPEDAALGMALVKSVIETGVGGAFETTLIHKEGHFVPYLISITRLLTPDGPAMMGVGIDITKRKRIEEERERLTAILNNTSDQVVMFYPDERLLYINAAGRSLRNWDETALPNSHVLCELFPSWAYDLLIEKAVPAVNKNGLWQGETALLGKDNIEIPVSQLIMSHRAADGHIEYYSSIMRDITERKRVEQERLEIERRLLHSQKLESLGVLAGGIAHDFNNLLMAITGNLDLALSDLPMEDPAVESIMNAMQASQRASDLTRQILAYSGKGRFVLDNLDLAELVIENTHLLRASIAKTVSFKLNVVPGLPPIEADQGQLQQVIMNLITNASEALDDQVGVITITTGEQYFDEIYLQASRVERKPQPGRFVFLEVMDTGCGMDETTLTRLFEPFFTTKFTGRGLGMAAVLGIVGGHSGAIFVNSTVGQGTVFCVLFPVTHSTLGRRIDTELKALAEGATMPSSGRVLIVDDEESIRRVCQSYLAKLGFKTLCASDGKEAVRLFEQHADEIVCVVLDLNMPQMDGLSAFRKMKSLRPDVQVILSSGFNEQAATQRFIDDGPAAFIQKPFRMRDLKQKIEQVLQTGRRSPI
jgi:PAS domain S-box-containing protein